MMNSTAGWNPCVVVFWSSYDLLPVLYASVVDAEPKTASNNEAVKIALNFRSIKPDVV